MNNQIPLDKTKSKNRGGETKYSQNRVGIL